MYLDDSVEEIHNIGKQRLRYLNNMGIYTVKDLIEYFPRDYDDRSSIKSIPELIKDEINTFIGEVAEDAQSVRFKNMAVTKAKIFDGFGEITAVWYNQPYLKRQEIYIYREISGEVRQAGNSFA